MDRDDANWVWISILPLGVGAWAPILGGVRARKTLWIVLGCVWSAITIAGWAGSQGDGNNSGAGGLIILGWIGAIATSFAVRDAYRRAVGSPFTKALREAERVTQEREQARKVAADEPEVARQLGIGRPDLRGSKDGGLVDFNNVPAATLASVPGIDAELAKRIVDCRSQSGFSSIEDMGAALDLNSNLVDALRDRAIFLPRSA